MNEERNPELERLFATADRTLADETFVAGVMTKTRTWSVRRLTILLVVLAAAAPAVWLLAAPVNEALRSLMELIAEPIVSDTGSGITSRITVPINSIGAAVALAALALRAVVRRLLPSQR